MTNSSRKHDELTNKTSWRAALFCHPAQKLFAVGLGKAVPQSDLGIALGVEGGGGLLSSEEWPCSQFQKVVINLANAPLQVKNLESVGGEVCGEETCTHGQL